MSKLQIHSVEQLVIEVKDILLKVSNLPQVNAATLDENVSLFDEGLGLDSIDILELVVHLDRNFGLKIKNDEKGRQTLRNVRSIAEAIFQQQSQLHGLNV